MFESFVLLLFILLFHFGIIEGHAPSLLVLTSIPNNVTCMSSDYAITSNADMRGIYGRNSFALVSFENEEMGNIVKNYTGRNALPCKASRLDLWMLVALRRMMMIVNFLYASKANAAVKSVIKDAQDELSAMLEEPAVMTVEVYTVLSPIGPPLFMPSEELKQLFAFTSATSLRSANVMSTHYYPVSLECYTSTTLLTLYSAAP